MIKRILFVLFMLSAVAARAQYNNEWIDYNKTYYKFPVGKDGLYRITQSVLQSIGLDNTPAEYFQLWRNGIQVPLYTSVASGALGAGGYMEFWGKMNDGKPDTKLYRNINDQLSDKWSLETDTASFFLTVNPSGGNFRMVDETNNVAGNTLAPEPYFMFTYGKYFKNRINPGNAGLVGEYVYSSAYDKGEGYASGDIRPATPLTEPVINNLFPYAGGPDGTFYITASGNALYNRNLRAEVNSTQLVNVAMNVFNDTRQQVPLPVSLISAGTAAVKITNTSTNPNDRMVVSKYEITYPRQFNFGNNTNFIFELPATGMGNFLRITNFNRGTAAPVLYDLSNHKRYTGDIAEAGVIKFALPPSVQKRKLVLMSAMAANVNIINALTPRNFIDYGQPDNHGNFLIISNPLLYSGANGNPVEMYRQYRSSSPGGSYVAKIYDIGQLTDQFAFGIKRHPFAVKNFIKYAEDIFQTKPQAIFLIGKGVNYIDARANQANPLLERLNLVPSFGHPDSDNLLVARDNQTVSSIPVGRLSVVSPAEVELYLNKVKEYESMAVNAPHTVAGRGWMKNAVHAVGGGNAALTVEIGGYMNQLKHIISDTLYGGNVKTFSKMSAVASQLTNEGLRNLFKEGLGIVNYFGHSSSTNIDFNIEDPGAYENQGKYPMFFVNGCLAGDIFSFDQNRLNTTNTLSEKFVLANERGAIGFIASSHFGIVSYLNSYLTGLYDAISEKEYGHTIGETLEESFRYLMSVWGTDFFARLHAEEITLHGDPAVKLYAQPQPDYVVEDQFIQLPPLISVADRNFNLSVKFFNIGKAISDSLTLEIKRQLPDGSVTVLTRKRIPGILFNDSIQLTIPVNPVLEKGENKLIITADADNEIDEISESNNSVSKIFYIVEDEATPVYPYKFSIVTNSNISFYASTANPLSVMKNYIMEIDTTASFDSPVKKSDSKNSTGGLLEFKPPISFSDSSVYYWRVAAVPPAGQEYSWTKSSFIYLDGSTEGFNQSHYYQYLENEDEGMALKTDRQWKFDMISNSLIIRNGVYPTASGFQASYVNSLNGEDVLGAGCNYNELIFQIIDPITFKPWTNDFSGPTGLYNSLLATCGGGRTHNFQYLLSSSTSRKKAMDFLDTIPDGSYVIVRSNASASVAGNTYADQWKADTTLFGSGNSLYHKLFNQGFTSLDSFNRPRAFSFVFKKDSQDEFAPKTQFSMNQFDLISMGVECPSPDSVGYIVSPKLGPAKEWKALHWNGVKLENPSSDKVAIEIVAIKPDQSEHTVYSINETDKDFDISAIDALQYPYLRLRMKNADTSRSTPYQLKYWRLNYVPVPEGAVAPNIYFESKDTIEAGEKLKFGIAFKNISPAAFDSLKVKLSLLDKNNLQHVLDTARRKMLISGDTLKMEYVIEDTRNYPGLNTLVMNFNPDNDQAEQYLLNNFLYKSVYVRPDNLNPLLDVTFDGVHILNNDIVSASPHILMKLKDDSRFLALDDTSLVKVQVRYPDGTLRAFSFNNDTLRFTPSSVTSGGTDNTATIDFNPSFFEDGDYELIVSGRDKSGNAAGQTEYTVSFKIINKPMISNMFNYPNPFTTSTAFVFTLTGSDVPQNIRIQVLTITGKIVREITKEELGPIRIGRNITEFKWDGTDQYGQKLANGVYLYRVITNLNGKSLDRYKTEGDNTDQYFNKGYGKMYLMR